ncbi:hypothetical protein SLS55_005394 [Diplodia seriata]|uniref:DUF7730 domain-containing protein n=1 Tax=Diplodia seriata TaxID=420778 RepID=A0ABR3CG99_9PEZI
MHSRQLSYRNGNNAQATRTVPDPGVMSQLLSVARTCRALYRDVVPLLYGNEHVFAFSEERALLKFLSITPSSHLRCVRHVATRAAAVVNGWQRPTYADDWAARAERLADLPRLRTLEVLVSGYYLRGLLAGDLDVPQLNAAMEMVRPFAGRRGGDRLMMGSKCTFVILADAWPPAKYPALLAAAFREEEIPFEKRSTTNPDIVSKGKWSKVLN